MQERERCSSEPYQHNNRHHDALSDLTVIFNFNGFFLLLFLQGSQCMEKVGN